MKTKRLLVLVMVAVMIMGILSGCGKGSEQSSSEASTVAAEQSAKTDENPFAEKMEISVGMWDIEKSLVEGDKILEKIYEKFNIKFIPFNMTWDDYKDKVNLWAASGQLPDIFAIDEAGTSKSKTWAKQGVVKAIPDDLSKYTNLEKLMSRPDVQGYKIDNKMYFIPRAGANIDGIFDRGIIYRWDWAQKLGITKEPETWDEFVNLLKAYTTADPDGNGKKDTVGLTAINYNFLESTLMLFFNPAVSDDHSGTTLNWVKEDGKWMPAFFSKNTIPGLKSIKQAYTDGLIDKDFAVLKGDEGVDKFFSGHAGALAYKFDPAKMDQYNKQKWSKNFPDLKFNDSIKSLKSLPAPDGNRYRIATNSFWSETYINNNVDDKKLDRILSLADYMVSEEGGLLTEYGFEGEDYTKEGSEIKMKDPNADLMKKYPSMTAIPWIFKWGMVMPQDNPTVAEEFKKQGKELFDWFMTNTKKADIDYQINLMETPAKAKLVVKHGDDFCRLIVSKGDLEKEFNDMKNTYEMKGLKQAIEEVTAEAAKLGK